jgi:hypothetical protein
MDIKFVSSLSQRIGQSDKNAWQIAGNYLDAAPSREAALCAAISDLVNGVLPDVLVADGTALPAKEILFFISSRPTSRNEPNV